VENDESRRHTRHPQTVEPSNAVKHDDAIAILLASAPGASPERAPAPSAASAAREHVAACSDCFDVLALLHEVATGESSDLRAQGRALYGCEAAREVFHRALGLDAPALAQREPMLSRHLGWCLACRERFAEVLMVERLATRGDVEPLLASERAEWRQVVRAGGDVVRELMGRLAVRVGRSVAAFTEVPLGLEMLAAPAPVGLRRTTPAVGDVGMAQHLRVPVGDDEYQLDIALQPQGSARVALVVSVAGRADLMLELRALEAGDLLARSTLRDDRPVVVRDLAPGRYTLEIIRQLPALRCSLRLDVESAG
jgi:hypothetical protein